jgi:type II secretory pathway component PulF
VRLRELGGRHRAQLFAQLAQTEKAGLTAADSIRMMAKSADAALGKRLEQFLERLAAGSDTTRAGLASGLFLSWEARLLQAAEASGKLAESYTELARRHANRASRNSALKRGMTLPLALFVLAVLVLPLPDLLTGAIDIGSYLLSTSSRLLFLFTALYLLARGWRRLGAAGADNTLYRILLRAPWFGRLVRRQQQYDYLFSLALLLDAGVPAFDALSVAAGSVSHPTLRARFSGAEKMVRNGASVTDALESCGILPNENEVNLVRAGEFSGRLSESLHHVASQLDEQIELQFSVLADWAPKFGYLAVVISVILG